MAVWYRSDNTVLPYFRWNLFFAIEQNRTIRTRTSTQNPHTLNELRMLVRRGLNDALRLINVKSQTK